ncbi:MAG: DUF1552 domain-containing protein [Myxococcota bacterium]
MTVSRRTLLRGLGAAAMTLPIARGLAPSVARGRDDRPCRFLAIFTPHGSVLRNWRPRSSSGGAASETDFTFDFDGSVLRPMERHRDQLVVLDGVDYRVLAEEAATGHEGGMTTFLTGSAYHPERGGQPYGDSIDEHLATTIGATTPRRTMRLGVLTEGGQSIYDTISFSGGGLVREPTQIDPSLVYESFFAQFMTGGDEGAARAAMERLHRRRQSVLDYALDDLAALDRRVPHTERMKLEAHTEALRTIELRLTRELDVGTGACRPPASPNRLDAKSVDAQPAIVQTQADLIAQAFACDLTRVATLTIHHAGAPYAMPWLNLNGDMHHDVAHTQGTEGSAQYIAMQTWYSEQVAYLLDQLAAIPEGDGTVLDNTLVLWGNELGHPSIHNSHMVPFVLAGGAGGLRTGRYLRFRDHDDPFCHDHYGSGNCTPPNIYDEQLPHNKLHTSVLQLLGEPERTYFGDPRYADRPQYQGGLPGLL